MKLDQLIAGMPIVAAKGASEVAASDLFDDSRDVTPGSLFIDRAATGDVEQRQTYIRKAINAGAAAVLTDQTMEEVGLSGDVNQGWCWLTASEPVDQAMAGALAERFFGHPSEKLKLIGITGTNGKTTVAMLTQCLLQKAGHRCGLIGTVAIHDGESARPAKLTTPGAIDFSRYLASMVANGCTAAVAEMSSHGLHQGRTAALHIDIGVFTNLTGDHLDYHGTMDDYAAAKAILFAQLNDDGWAIVNSQDERSKQMIRGCRASVIRCFVDEARHASDSQSNSDQPLGDARAVISQLAADHSVARFEGPWGQVDASLPLVGRHNIANALQAITAANVVADLSSALTDALSTLPVTPGRLEPVSLDEAGDTLPIVLVDYAHTHDALDNVLRALRTVMPKDRRLLAVFGCGGDRDKSKRPKMGKAAATIADVAIVTSDNPRSEDPQSIVDDILVGMQTDSADQHAEQRAKIVCEVDRQAAIELAIQMAQPGDVVLLAGKGHEDYQIIGQERRHFDDREEAEAALRRRLAQDVDPATKKHAEG